MKNLFAFLLVFLVSAPSFAMDGKAHDHKISVGSEIPSIETVDQNNEKQNLASLSGEKGVVLVFYRSVDWCPFCQKQLKKLESHREQFQLSGYNLVGISYDVVQSLKKFSQRNKVAFDLLSDTDSSIIKSFGLLNEDVSEGSKAYGTPHPAIYIVQKDATVQAVLQEKGYKDRPEIEDILNAL